MKLKSYYASSVEAAIQQARIDLGEDAMLMDSRTSSQEARHMGAYEVVFALPDQSPPVTTPRFVNAKSPQPSTPASEPSRLAGDFAELRRELDRMREAVARSSSHSVVAAGVLSDPEFARVYNTLLSIDVAPDVAQDLLVRAAQRPVRDTNGATQPRRLENALRQAVLESLPALPELGSNRKPTPRIVMVAGPPGAGKTSSLVKLAVQYGLRNRKPMAIIAVDNFRTVGSDSLRNYSAILGVPFYLIENVNHLPSLLDEHKTRHWIWIDTPGLGPRDADAIQEISTTIRNLPEIDVHLVLSASMKSSDLRTTANRFATLEPAKLLFTHMDETRDYGGLLTAAAHSGKPFSFLCGGQQIPEDIEAASSERLLSLLLDPPDLRLEFANNHAARAGVGA